ncbi:MAG: sporulation initiation factor Spo0A C-terminal domain-containing protein [Lachnospiraceae bacterium]|jgi:hypothetical protein
MISRTFASSCLPGTAETVEDTVKKYGCAYAGNAVTPADAALLVFSARPDVFVADEALSFDQIAVLMTAVRNLMGGGSPEFVYLPLCRKNDGTAGQDTRNSADIAEKMTNPELVREPLLFYNHNEESIRRSVKKGSRPESVPEQDQVIEAVLRQLVLRESSGGASGRRKAAGAVYLESLMELLGFRCDETGWSYLREAVLECLGKDELLYSVNKILYPIVAEKFGTSAAAVEKAIRRSAAQAWERSTGESRGQFTRQTGRSVTQRLSGRRLILLLTRCVSDFLKTGDFQQ